MALIGSILLVGGGIIAALFLTRTPSIANKTEPFPVKLEQEALLPLVQEKSEEVLKEETHSADAKLKLTSAKLPDSPIILLKIPQDADAQRAAERKLAREKRRRDQKEDFDRLIDQAALAVRNQRYNDAILSYQKALAIFPDDPIAARALAEARQAMTNASSQMETLMTRGTIAMRDARFKDALDVFQEATRLSPANQSVATALRVAELAFENQASYITAMRRGNLALNNLLWDDAAASFTIALRLVPNDALATLGLQNAQKGQADYVRRRAECDLLIQAGNTAAKQRKYAEAARDFKDALRILPNYPQADALGILFRYNDNMADGTSAINARRYQEAIRHFQAALMEIPNDVTATAALTRARMANNKN